MCGLKIRLSKLTLIIAFVFMASNGHAASYTVGTDGDYATLSALFTDLGEIVSGTTITLVSDITETGEVDWSGEDGSSGMLDGDGYAITYTGGDTFQLADGMEVKDVWFKN